MEKLSKEKFVAAHFILSDECNLRCPYCFVDHKKNIMSREVAKKGVDFLFNGAIESGSNSIVITFFGGEPTLNIDLMKEILDYALLKSSDIALQTRKNIKPFFSMVTNGMIWSDELTSFLEYWREKTGVIDVELSYDGIPEVQNFSRIAYDLNGHTSGEMMEINLPKIVEFAKKNSIKLGEEIYIHSVVTRKSLPYLSENWKYFNEQGFPGFWHLMLLEEEWTDDDAKLYDSELNKIFDYCKETNTLDNLAVNKTFRPQTSPNGCGAGKNFCAFSPDGKIYVCHRLYEHNPDDFLGELISEETGTWYIDEEKKAYYESLSGNFVGEKSCDKCGETCYTCIAANIEKNLLPNLCFVAHCKMTHIENVFRKKLILELGANAFAKNNRNVPNFMSNDKQRDHECGDNCHCGDTQELLMNYSNLVAQYETTMVKLMEAFQELGLIFVENYEKLENKVDNLTAQNQDVLNLLLASLIKQEENKV